MSIPQTLRRLFPWCELAFLLIVFLFGCFMGCTFADRPSDKSIQAHAIAQALRSAADAIDQTNPPAK